MIAALPSVAALLAEREAERRGLELTVGSARLGWGRIWLRDLSVRMPEVPALHVRVATLAVYPGLNLRPRRLIATGGLIEVRGAPEEVLAQVKRWRAQRDDQPRSKREGTSSDREYHVSGLSLAWRAPAGALFAWGLRYTTEGAHERIAADRVQGALRSLELAVLSPAATLVRHGGERMIQQISSADVRVRWALELEQAAALGPATPAAASGSATDAKSPSRGERLRALLDALSRELRERLAPAGRVQLSGVRVLLEKADEKLNIGPAEAQLVRGPSGFQASFLAGGGHRQTPLSLRLQLPLDTGPVSVELVGGPVSLAALGVGEGDFGLSNVREAAVEASGTAALSADGQKLSFRGAGNLQNAALLHPKLARAPLHDLTLSWRGHGELLTDGTHAHLVMEELRVGRTRAELDAELWNTDSRVAFRLRGGIPLASCQDMLESAPRGLLPLLKGSRMSGTFSLTANVSFDSLELAETQAQLRFTNDCRFTAVPEAIAPSRFASTFSYNIKDERGQTVRIHTGPDTPGWTRYENISRFMQASLLVNEDGRFFRHRGFDQEAISNSIRENLKAGRFSRGGSTITMQLAKNVYLEREKTLARKLQEAALTTLLEQELTKERILELYLNVIEFGPGIYGITAAAQHYFNTTPAELSLAQAFFLGSILPKPSADHFARDGLLKPGWTKYLRRLLQIARQRELITEAELEAGLEEQLAFGVAPQRSLDTDYAPGVFEAGAEAPVPPPEDEF